MELTTMVAFGALGTIAGGWIADRLVHLPVARALLAATIVSMLAVILTPSPRVFLPIALTGFVLFQSLSLTVTLCQDYPPSHVGTSAGVMLGLAISVGGLLAPSLSASADATRLRLGLDALSAFLPVALALAQRPREWRAQRRTDEQRRAA